MTADGQVWLVSGCAREWEGRRERVGPNKLARKAEQAWATAAPSSFLSLLFLLLRFKFS